MLSATNLLIADGILKVKNNIYRIKQKAAVLDIYSAILWSWIFHFHELLPPSYLPSPPKIKWSRPYCTTWKPIYRLLINVSAACSLHSWTVTLMVPNQLASEMNRAKFWENSNLPEGVEPLLFSLSGTIPDISSEITAFCTCAKLSVTTL